MNTLVYISSPLTWTTSNSSLLIEKGFTNKKNYYNSYCHCGFI